MPHPSEAMLVAFADDELGPAERSLVSDHVRGCGVCRHALRDVRDAMAAVHVESALIDAAEPASWRQPVRPPVRPARAASPRSRPAAAPPAAGEGPRRQLHLAPLRWAAVFLVFVAGGATAMLAPRWRAIVTGAPLQAPTPTTPAFVEPVADAAPLRTSAAVSVLPRAGRATVVLQPAGAASTAAAAATGLLVVTIGDRADVQVTVTSLRTSVDAPRFRTADGRLDVALTGAETRVEVEVPASLAEAHIVVGTRAAVSVRAGIVSPSQASTTGVPLRAER